LGDDHAVTTELSFPSQVPILKDAQVSTDLKSLLLNNCIVVCMPYLHMPVSKWVSVSQNSPARLVPASWVIRVTDKGSIEENELLCQDEALRIKQTCDDEDEAI